jgi:ADP-ribosylation factor GTPase-activating protein 2/3
MQTMGDDFALDSTQELYARRMLTAQELTAIEQKGGNHRCCECNKRGAEWASISFGVILCAHCSAFHRGTFSVIFFCSACTTIML